MHKTFNALTDMTPEIENSLNRLSDIRSAWCKVNETWTKNCCCEICTNAKDIAESNLMTLMWGKS